MHYRSFTLSFKSKTGCGLDPRTWPSTISDSLKSYFHGLGSSQPLLLDLTNRFPKCFD
jgi:hypothetical protein